MSLVTQRSENWSGIKASMNKIEAFHHKSIRYMLGISMGQMKDEEVKSTELVRSFDCIESATNAWRRRQLLFFNKIAWLDNIKCPQRTLTEEVEGKRRRGMTHRTLRDSIVEILATIIYDLSRKGRVDTFSRRCFLTTECNENQWKQHHDTKCWSNVISNRRMRSDWACVT